MWDDFEAGQSLFSILSIRKIFSLLLLQVDDNEKKGEERKKDSYPAYETDVAIKSL